MIGERFGRLLVLGVESKVIKGRSIKMASCICDCGTLRVTRVSSLRYGYTKSCGCLSKETASERATTHGNSSHPLFRVWYDMNRRCYDSKRKDFKHYGGRGVLVCDRWKYARSGGTLQGFDNFLEDMFSEYSTGLELDRVDVEGNYCKDNCRWVDRSTQLKNTRYNKAVSPTYDKLESITKLPRKVINDRLNKLGWTEEEVINTPPRVKAWLFDIGDGELRKTRDLLDNYRSIRFTVIARHEGVEAAVNKIFGDISIKVYAKIHGELILRYQR